ncbi:MAG: formate dehydrogenase, partial [Chloroflexi bacterium]
MGEEAISPQTRQIQPRTRDAKVTLSVCPYCAIGCSTLIYSRNGQVIDIEGNPDSPINAGALCPKGAATYQLTVNPDRVTTVLYRAPYSSRWERRPLEWAMDRIAERIKETRDKGFVHQRSDGLVIN